MFIYIDATAFRRRGDDFRQGLYFGERWERLLEFSFESGLESIDSNPSWVTSWSFIARGG